MGPAASFYNPDDMTSSGRAAFYAWYEKQQGVFDFQHEFLTYCVSDVDILQRCCAQFRQTVERFEEAIMFASTANLAYRRGFMPQDSIAVYLIWGTCTNLHDSFR